MTDGDLLSSTKLSHEHLTALLAALVVPTIPVQSTPYGTTPILTRTVVTFKKTNGRTRAQVDVFYQPKRRKKRKSTDPPEQPPMTVEEIDALYDEAERLGVPAPEPERDSDVKCSECDGGKLSLYGKVCDACDGTGRGMVF